MQSRPQNELVTLNSSNSGEFSSPRTPFMGPPPRQAGSKLPQYLKLIWASNLRWWKVTLPLGVLLGGIAGSLAWISIVPTYSANAVLRIKQSAPYVAYPSTNESRSFVNTQLQLFRTRVVVEPALDDVYKKAPEVAKKKSDPVKWIQDGISARSISGSELVRVSFSDPSPKLSKQVVQAVVDSYLLYHLNYSSSVDEKVVEVLQDEKVGRQKSLQALRADVKEASKKAVIAPSEFNPLSASLQSIQNLLIQTEVELAVSKAELVVAENQVEQSDLNVPESEMLAMMRSQPDYIRMQQSFAQFESRLEEIRKRLRAPESSERYQQLKGQRDELEASMAEYEQRFQTDGHAAAITFMKAEQQRQLAGLKRDIQAKETMKEYLTRKLQDAVAEGDKSSSEKNAETVEFEMLSRELKQQEDVYNRISERIMSLQTERMAPARVELVDEAIKPKNPDNSPWSMVGVAAMMAFLIPLGVVVLVEHCLQRITDISLIRDENLEVVGEIATLPKYLPASGASEGQRVARQLTLFEESVDHLCNSLRLTPELSSHRAIAVVSAISGEGKTHVSTQLAISLAKSLQEPVLLMETDFRSPDIAQMLGFEPREGLLDVLVDGRNLDETIIRDVHPRLDVLVAGKQHRDLHALLQHDVINDLFESLKTEYRYIIIDTPPILAAGEATLFANHADAALICARRGYSRMSQVVQVRDRLTRAGANPIGVVLNGVPRGQYLHSYGSYEFVSS